MLYIHTRLIYVYIYIICKVVCKGILYRYNYTIVDALVYILSILIPYMHIYIVVYA